MRAGTLRHRIRLQSLIETRDDTGGVVYVAETYATVWGSVGTPSAREFQQSDSTAADATHDVSIRYRADVLPKHRCLVNGKTFEIQSVVEVEGRRRELHLLCKEVVRET